MENNFIGDMDNRVNKNEYSELLKYKELSSQILGKVSSLEQDWLIFKDKKGNSFPSTKRALEVIEFLTSDEIAEGPFIRDFYYVLENYVEKENSMGNYSTVKKFVKFNYSLRMSQKIIWEINDKKDEIIESLKKIENEVNKNVNLIEIKHHLFDIGYFYLSMESLSFFLRDMINVFKNEVN